MINQKLIQESLSYESYSDLVHTLLEQGKTTGNDQSQAMIDYTRLNAQRMKRLNKTTELLPNSVEIIKNLGRKIIWLTITEAWCGDASQIVPVVEKIAAASEGNILHRLILRDQYPQIMDMFLTNGTKSIPKIIILDAQTLEVMGVWGPRPEAIQEKVVAFKKNPTGTFADIKELVQRWYNEDKTVSVQTELLTATVESLKVNA